MKKKFALAFTLATAALVTGCGPQPVGDGDWTDDDVRVCRDRRGNRLPDRYCEDRRYNNGGANSLFFWYFISRGGYVPNVGSRFDDNYNRRYGGYRPVSGRSYTPARPYPSVSRGGFGGSSRGGSSAS